VKKRFRDRGMPVLACVADEKEAEEVRPRSAGADPGRQPAATERSLPAHPRDVRSRVAPRAAHPDELAVAYREPGIYTGDQYNYDTIRSLSLGGCFIESRRRSRSA